jgi:hypothetical protein
MLYKWPLTPSELELAGLYHGKTLAWYDGCNSDQVALAHELVAELLAAEEQPFDAILANSQGASLAISYLLHQQILHPNQPLPIRFAVLFTPGIIISPDREYKSSKVDSFLGKLDPIDIEKITRGLLDSNGRARIEPEMFVGLRNLYGTERELCLALVSL